MRKVVEGFNNLVRDDTGAIVSTSKSDYEVYIQKRNKEKNLQAQITNLQSEMKEIKDMLSQLLGKLK